MSNQEPIIKPTVELEAYVREFNKGMQTAIVRMGEITGPFYAELTKGFAVAGRAMQAAVDASDPR